MAQVKFYRGNKESYDASSKHKDGIYFASDSNEILVNGVSYGLNPEKISELTELINGFVKTVEFTSPNVIKFKNGTSGDVATVTLPEATGSAAGLMSSADKSKLDGVAANAQVNVIEEIQVDGQKVDPSSKKVNIQLQSRFDEKANVANTYNKGEVDAKISQAVSSAYKVKGTKENIGEVLKLADAKVGDVWNVTAGFTLSEKKYPAGTNVVCTENTSSAEGNDSKWDALGGTIDLAPYIKTSDADGKYVAKSSIVNDLTGGVDKVLSAEQGKALKTLVDGKLTSVTATANKGILVEGTGNAPTIGIQLDGSTESFLTLGESGLKLSGVEAKIDEKVNAVKSLTINTKELSTNPVLNGADIKLDGYTVSEEVNEQLELAPTDTVNQAFGKLHKAILDNEEVVSAAFVKFKESLGFNEDGSYIPTSSELTGKNVTEAIDYLNTAIKGLGDIQGKLDSMKSEIVGGATTYTNLKKVEDALNTLNGVGDGSFKKYVDDQFTWWEED